MSQKTGHPRGVFDDFSLSTVVASALTAATSFLLTSRIGLAGSLIGAMAASVISTASTQVYKGMLTASADRIKEAAGPAAPLGRHASGEARPVNPPARGFGRLAGRLALFAACASLVAVLANASIISFATCGAGLGPTTWEPVAVVEEAGGVVSGESDESAAAAEAVEEGVEKGAGERGGEDAADAEVPAQASDVTNAAEEAEVAATASETDAAAEEAAAAQQLPSASETTAAEAAAEGAQPGQ